MEAGEKSIKVSKKKEEEADRIRIAHLKVGEVYYLLAPGNPSKQRPLPKQVNDKLQGSFFNLAN